MPFSMKAFPVNQLDAGFCARCIPLSIKIPEMNLQKEYKHMIISISIKTSFSRLIKDLINYSDLLLFRPA
jgi:REP element-mobilizing transposase RayT